MYWYATEPVVAADPKTGVQLLAACKLPKVRQFITAGWRLDVNV